MLRQREVQPSLLFTDTLKEKLEYLINDLKVNNFIMYVHPYVDAYLKKDLCRCRADGNSNSVANLK